jgi:uncharacterized membrane protein
MALAVAVLIPRFRRIAGWGLIALLVVIFPANIHAALYGSDQYRLGFFGRDYRCSLFSIGAA